MFRNVNPSDLAQCPRSVHLEFVICAKCFRKELTLFLFVCLSVCLFVCLFVL